MARPKCENGFTRIANELYDEILKRNFSKRQLNIIFFILRFSFGYSRKETEEIKFIDFELCGIDKSDIKRELKNLDRSKVILWNKENNTFSLNKNYEEWAISFNSFFDDEKLNKLVKHQLQVCKTPTEELVKHQPTEAEKLLSDCDTIPPKEIERNKNITTTTEEKKDEFKVYGIYENVCLSDQQYQKLSTLIMSNKVLTEIINNFSENLAEKMPGKLEPEFDGIQNHFVRLNSYWQYRRKHPEKFIEGFNTNPIKGGKSGSGNKYNAECISKIGSEYDL